MRTGVPPLSPTHLTDHTPGDGNPLRRFLGPAGDACLSHLLVTSVAVETGPARWCRGTLRMTRSA